MGDGLGQPVEQDAVDCTSDRAAGSLVACPDHQLGLARAEGGDLQVGVEAREQRRPVGRRPAERHDETVSVAAGRPGTYKYGLREHRRPTFRADFRAQVLSLRACS